MPQIVASLITLFSLLSFSSCALFGPRSIEGISMQLHPFKSDGCSVFPDGKLSTGKNEWLHCCFVHDISYWVGGTKLEKEFADDELNQCVSKATNRSQGEMMELGVEIGGSPQTGLPWRFGYGWDIEAPFFTRGLRHIKEINEKYDSIYEEFNNWRSKLSFAQIEYIELKIIELKKRLNI